MQEGFVFVDEYVKGIRWDAKYATWDNFTGRPVDGYYVNRIAGTIRLCEGLKKAQKIAKENDLGLLLWDAYRPQRAVDCFIQWSEKPEDGRTKAKHYPSLNKKQLLELGYVDKKSGHSRGGAVDLTLYRISDQELLDMGGDFDYMDVLSHHHAAGIGKVPEDNRNLLSDIMQDSGFLPYKNEWWHYVLADEPYPDTYFDVPIL